MNSIETINAKERERQAEWKARRAKLVKVTAGELEDLRWLRRAVYGLRVANRNVDSALGVAMSHVEKESPDA